MNIRPATLSDVPAIVAVERNSDTAAHWSETEYRNVFVAGSTPRIIMLAEETGVLGFVVVRTIGPEWEIENVAVTPDARRRGIGLALLASLKAQAEHRGSNALILEVRASNAAARALYLRAGFAEFATRRDYYAHPTEDAILYRFEVRSRLSSAP